AMDLECHPVWRDYHNGRIRAGDSVEKIIAETEPIQVDQDNRWVVLNYQGIGYYTGITAIAYDGQMVAAYAWSCAWTRQFFDVMSEVERAEFPAKFYGQPAR